MPIKNMIHGQQISAEKLELARRMRTEMTPGERLLWQELRGNRLGAHFRRQQIIAGFIVDFYCHEAALVIEVDGDVHDEPAQAEYDARRDQVFCEMGLRVMRVRNAEVMGELPVVLERIRRLVGT